MGWAKASPRPRMCLALTSTILQPGKPPGGQDRRGSWATWCRPPPIRAAPQVLSHRLEGLARQGALQHDGCTAIAAGDLDPIHELTHQEEPSPTLGQYVRHP